MILGKIVAGALAIVWEIESAFVNVSLGSVVISRGTNTTCAVTNATANLTGCGQSLSDALVSLTIGGVNVLNGLLTGLSVTGGR